MNTTPALTLLGVSKTFGSVPALTDVTLTVHPGTVHCVLGENGAGKSTLCNLVFGAIQPDGGQMSLAGRPYAPSSPAHALTSGVAMVHQHFSLIPTMTVRENLLLAGGRGLRDKELRLRLQQVNEEYGLHVALDSQISALPIGARQKVEIVKALLGDPGLILLDEPTGVLDPAEIDTLISTCQAMAASGKAVVLITHKLGEVSRVADAATVLRGGRVAESGRMSALTIPQLLTAMVGRAVSDLNPALAATIGAAATPTVERKAAPARPEVLTVEGLTVRRPDGSTALADASITVRAGEVVGIAGVEGNGQTELVEAISGSRTADSGTVTLDGTTLHGPAGSPKARSALGLGVIPEDRHREGMVAELSVAENLFLGRLGQFQRFGLLNRRALERAARALVEQFHVRAEGPWAPMRSLSGGNQQKVVLARETTLDNLRCLVAAQPTRGLDIGAVDFVLDRLRAAADDGAGVLVVSSELAELVALCDRVFVAYRGELLGPVDTSAPGATRVISELMMGTAA